MVSEVFEKLVNNRLVDHQKKCGLFLFSSKSSQSTADFLTVVSDKSSGAFNVWGLALAFDISKTLTGFGMLVFFTKISLMQFRSDIWPYFVFPQYTQLQVVVDGKSSQESPVNARDPQGSILGPTLFLL